MSEWFPYISLGSMVPNNCIIFMRQGQPLNILISFLKIICWPSSSASTQCYEWELKLKHAMSLCRLVYDRSFEEYDMGLTDHFVMFRFLTQLKKE